MTKKEMNKRMFKMVEAILKNDYYCNKQLDLKWYEVLNDLSRRGKIDYFIVRYFIQKSFMISCMSNLKNSPYKKIHHKHIFEH